MGRADFRVVRSSPKNRPDKNPDYVILLPPSESKSELGTIRTNWNPASGIFGARLKDSRDQVIDALSNANGGNATLLGVGGKHLERANLANRSLRGATTLPAHQRYTGVVWDHLDLDSLTSSDLKSALDHIVVISGLLGAVGASDPVPDYRLKMSARLAPLGTMSRWWCEPLSAVLNEYFAGLVVIDILPQVHRRAYLPDVDRLNQYLRVDLIEKSGQPGGHAAKAAKGRLARHVLSRCTDGADVRSALKSFHDPLFAVSID